MLAASIITAAATVALATLAYFQIRAGRTQTAAALALARETREAAERQWQPRVIGYPWRGQIPGDGSAPAPGDVAVPYYLANDGTGPAFNVEHGVEVAGTVHTWEFGPYRSMGAGLELPPVHDTVGLPVGVSPIIVEVKGTELDGAVVAFWTRFENLLGERFVVRNYTDARPVEFERVP